MNEIRKHQLGHMAIYKEMQIIAEKNDIKIFAFYGTMLGLKRHNGFIPWDDDVDVAVWNEDYEKFINALERDLPKRFKVSRRSANWKSNMDEAGVLDLESSVYKNKQKTSTRTYSVDIFRFGFLKKDVKKVPFKRNFWRGIQFVGNRGTRSFWAKKGKWLITHLLPGKWIHKKVDKIDAKISTKNPEESILAYDMGDNWIEPFDSKTFKEFEIVHLEGIPIYMPKDPSPFLKSNYGNWEKPVKWNNKLHYF